MKIAIITHDLSISGGTEQQVLQLAHKLTECGHNASIYTFAFNAQICFPSLSRGVRIEVVKNTWNPSIQLTKIRFLGSLIHYVAENRRAKALARQIDRDTDILNPHTQTATKVSYYFKKLVNKSVPSVWMFNDLTLANWSLFDDPLFGKAARSSLRYYVNCFYDWYAHLRFFKTEDCIVAVSERARSIIRMLLKRDAEVVHIGVDLERILYKNHISCKIPTILLCQGIFYRHRRFEDVIRSISFLREEGYQIRLIIVGEYQKRDIFFAYYRELMTLVQELQLQDIVSFCGPVSDSKLFNLYYTADIFISVAHMQTWGIAVFEALAAGLPTVVSRTIGAAEVLHDGETAIFIEPGKPKTIADAVKRLIDGPELYKKLSEEGAEFVRKNLSWKKYAENMLDIFKNVS